MTNLDRVVWPRTARWRDGVLTVGGVDVRDLASDFGAPLFVCDEVDFRSRCRDFRAAFGDDAVNYTAGAFCCREVLRWAAQEGLGIAVDTEGELRTALSAGLPGRILTLYGSNKSVGELSRAMDAGVEHIVLDSFEEIARLAYLAERGSTRQKTLIKVINREDADSYQPGFALASGEAAEAVRRILGCPELELAGLHSAGGLRSAPAEDRAWLMIELAATIRDEHQVQIGELNLGAVASTGEDTASLIARNLADVVGRGCREAGLSRPRLTVEPDEAIAGPGTLTLHEVGTVRNVPSGSGLKVQVGGEGAMRGVVGNVLSGGELGAQVGDEGAVRGPVLSGSGLGAQIGGEGAMRGAVGNVASGGELGAQVGDEGAARATVLSSGGLGAQVGDGGAVRDQVLSGGELGGQVGGEGTMRDNGRIRTARCDDRYTCVLASRESTAPPVLASVTGRHRESGDIVVRDTYLPSDLAPGDLLAVAGTGAYRRSAAGNDGQVPRPAVVGVRDATARVLIRRETIEDVLRLDAG